MKGLGLGLAWGSYERLQQEHQTSREEWRDHRGQNQDDPHQPNLSGEASGTGVWGCGWGHHY